MYLSVYIEIVWPVCPDTIEDEMLALLTSTSSSNYSLTITPISNLCNITAIPYHYLLAGSYTYINVTCHPFPYLLCLTIVLRYQRKPAFKTQGILLKMPDVPQHLPLPQVHPHQIFVFWSLLENEYDANVKREVSYALKQPSRHQSYLLLTQTTTTYPFSKLLLILLLEGWSHSRNCLCTYIYICMMCMSDRIKLIRIDHGKGIIR